MRGPASARRKPSLLIALALLATSTTACFDSHDALPALPAAESSAGKPEALPGWRRSVIDTILDARIWQGARSGYVVLVARDGRLVHARTAGHQDLEAGIPMSMETRFQIASMTKPVIAVAAMTLVEEGRLGLDDLVSDHLPEFADMRVALLDEAGAAEGTQAQDPPMRLRHLLSFTSGLARRGSARASMKGLSGIAGSGRASTMARGLSPNASDACRRFPSSSNRGRDGATALRWTSWPASSRRSRASPSKSSWPAASSSPSA